ncbi:transmembrane protein sting [Anticarsia gemmatalis]|uniref:transmembrane protein sting n=1 Tax=Anticarsia gemmatalis TaxID=129554 RepID=UPI003F7711B3
MIEKRKPKMDQSHIYLMQILFVAGITFGSQSLDFSKKNQWIFSVARYVLYILTIQGTKSLSLVLYDMVHHQRGFDHDLLAKVNRHQLMMYGASIVLLLLNDQKLYAEDFPFIFIAYLVVKYPEVEKPTTKATVTYGNGMALSFIEGYLVHILPSDGADLVGLQENIKRFEARDGVVFPVKKMFLIITKSMHCPPDLKEFNDKSHREDVARLEACQLEESECDVLQSFEQVVKDVAGVKRRHYKNSAYKITRPARRPVYVAAECATPIHTLYRVIKNRDLYEELSDVNVEDIVSDFISTLDNVLTKSPELRGKCELVYFDDTKNLNLADVLLDRIRELEPNFEELANKRY